MSQPPHHPRSAVQPDGLEDVLQAFFRAEMPEPWPAFTPPAPAAAVPVRRRSLSRSRLTLAASVVLLLGGSLSLAHLFPASEGTPGPGSGPGIAARPRLHQPERAPVSGEDQDSSKHKTGGDKD